MRFHVVHAHPVETSFNRALFEAVLDQARKGGHEVDALDLYAEEFDPRLSRLERLNYHDTTLNRTDAVDVYAERLLRAEVLIFVHPIWNYGFPAMLKGYFDRIFLPGVSFVMDGSGDRGIPRANFTHIKHVMFVTTYGGNRWRTWLMGDPPRRVVKRWGWATFRTPKPPDYVALYDMNNGTPESRAAFVQLVRQKVSAIQ
ncbi:NAD(P)H-dependent oxidoreductase [Devosia sp. PTR5]|uniref:NAD(P)H-dependent oxidoreductase n=1 Tax=Devosia oryzisoli TaxID=2774138 RepID=A0A927FRX4_9HYPH|nr:NAD(P)H-dependent oxidoreductase [Devosia oryzisoli]MBD8065125.1 NAD(P)H-dependent oxidoreductase [Devosia oryzisoli]